MTNPPEIPESALLFAIQAHASIRQVRKYSKDWYIVHPIRVANIIRDYYADDRMISAAYLHDVLEDVARLDTRYNEAEMRKVVGDRVTSLVIELTNVYVTEDYPDLNRAERHKLEIKRIATISPEGQLIKLADILDNTSNILNEDPGFARKYITEKLDTIEVLINTSTKRLHNIVSQQLNTIKTKLNI